MTFSRTLASALSTSASFIKPRTVLIAGTYNALMAVDVAAARVQRNALTLNAAVWSREHVLFDTQYHRTPAGKYVPALHSNVSSVV
jgi:hypothetical protein